MLSLSKHVRWAGLLMLAGCAKPGAEAPKGETVACALDGSANFVKVCTLERIASEYVVHRPDGGFRRFVMAYSGNLLQLDGADAFTVAQLPGGMEIRIDGDRFRIPDVTQP